MITINKSALSEQDDSGEPVSPDVGTVIDLGGATAKVIKDNGDTIDLEVKTVNGQPVVAEAGDAAGEPTTEGALMEAAEQADKMAGL